MAATEKSKRQTASREARENGMTTVTLAHPISDRNSVQRLGLDGPAEVGDEITVTVALASSLINAGLVQIDPEDFDSVREALYGEPDHMPAGTEQQIEGAAAQPGPAPGSTNSDGKAVNP